MLVKVKRVSKKTNNFKSLYISRQKSSNNWSDVRPKESEIYSKKYFASASKNDTEYGISSIEKNTCRGRSAFKIERFIRLKFKLEQLGK